MLGKRTMLFVDAQNLFYGKKAYARENDDPSYEIDALELRDKFADGRDLLRSYWFDSYPTDDQIERVEDDDDDDRELSSKQGFFYMLERNGFRVDAKPLRMRDDGRFIEKGADIGLATELIAQGFNDSYEVAVLVTGDADFSRSIRYVQDQGKIVEVASFESQISSDLKTTADDYVKIDGFAEEIRR